MNSTVAIIKPRLNDELKPAYLIISIINLVFVVFGTIGNLFTFFVLIRKNLRTVYSYTRYLSALCIIDIICLYNWNFSLIYADVFQKMKIEFYSPLSCRIFSYIAYSSLQLSSWIMCVIGIDRIILLVSAKKSKTVNSNKFKWLKKINPFQSTVAIVSILTVVIMLFNILVIIINAEPYVDKNSKNNMTNSSEKPVTSSRTFTCYAPETFFKIWDIIHVLVYSLIPFCIIFIQNFLIAFLTLKHARRMNRYATTSGAEHQPGTSRSKFSNAFTSPNDKNSTSVDTSKKKTQQQQQQSKGSYVKNLLIFLTLSFFFTTLPYSLIYATNLNETYFKVTYTGSIIKRCLISLQYTRHSTNFLIYILTSTIIQNEIKKCFQEIKSFLFKRNY
jgi:hypothetical protein